MSLFLTFGALEWHIIMLMIDITIIIIIIIMSES